MVEISSMGETKTFAEQSENFVSEVVDWLDTDNKIDWTPDGKTVMAIPRVDGKIDREALSALVRVAFGL